MRVDSQVLGGKNDLAPKAGGGVECECSTKSIRGMTPSTRQESYGMSTFHEFDTRDDALYHVRNFNVILVTSAVRGQWTVDCGGCSLTFFLTCGVFPLAQALSLFLNLSVTCFGNFYRNFPRAPRLSFYKIRGVSLLAWELFLLIIAGITEKNNPL